MRHLWQVFFVAVVVAVVVAEWNAVSFSGEIPSTFELVPGGFGGADLTASC